MSRGAPHGGMRKPREKCDFVFQWHDALMHLRRGILFALPQREPAMLHAISGIVRWHRDAVSKIPGKKSLAGTIRSIIRHAFQPWKTQTDTSGLQCHASVEMPGFAFHYSLASGGVGGDGLMRWFDCGLCEVIEVTSLAGKRFRYDDLLNQGLEPVSALLQCFANGIYGRSIRKLKIATKTV